MILSALLVVSLVPITVFLFPKTALAGPGDSYTVTFEVGDGTNESDRVYTGVEDGTLLGTISGLNVLPPVAKAGWLFIGWLPLTDDLNQAVHSDLTFMAQWVQDKSGGNPVINRRWSTILGNSEFGGGWTVPPGAVPLVFNDVSRSGQTYLDYAYLLTDGDKAFLYFLIAARHESSSEYISYNVSGVPVTVLTPKAKMQTGSSNDEIEYTAWELELTQSMIDSIKTGGVLTGSFSFITGSGGNSIQGAELTFSNVRYVVEHVIWDGVNIDSETFMFSTPGVVLPGTPAGAIVTGTPVPIFGYEYDPAGTDEYGQLSGPLPEPPGSLTLKLYYKPDGSAPEWIIASRFAGNGVEVPYNGKVQKLSDYKPEALLFDITFPNDGIYVFDGDVIYANPELKDVGEDIQNLRPAPGYKIWYSGSHTTIPDNWQMLPEKYSYVKGDSESDEYELDAEGYIINDEGERIVFANVTTQMGIPILGNSWIKILPVPLTITTGSASGYYADLLANGELPLKTAPDDYIVGGTIVIDDVTYTGDFQSDENGVKETALITLIGEQWVSGTSYNEYEITWWDDDPAYTAKANNYIVYWELGELTLTAKGVAVEKTFTKVYGENDPELEDVAEALKGLLVQKLITEQGVDPDVALTITVGIDEGTGRVAGQNVANSPYTYHGFIFEWGDVPHGDDEELTATAVLTITPKPIKIIIGDSDKTYGEEDPALYGGWELSDDSSWEYTDGKGSLDITIIREGKGTDEKAGTYDDVLIAEDNAWNNPNYTVAFEPGDFTINKREITIKANDDTMVWDGVMTLTNGGHTITAGSLLAGHTSSVTVNGSQKDVGKSENVPDETTTVIKDENGVEVTDNYEIAYANGWLTVLPVGNIEVDLNGNYTKTYGEADPDLFVIEGDLQDAVDALLIAQGLKAGDIVVTVTGRASGENVSGPYAYEIEFTVADGIIFYDADGNAIPKEEAITLAADLTINKREITIKANDDTMVWDGETALTNGGSDVTEGSLAFDDVLDSVTVTGSRIPVGTEVNVISEDALILNAKGEDATSNYEITYVDGKLTVLPAGNIEVDINGHYTKVYGDTTEPDLSVVEDDLQTAVNEQLIAQGLNAGDIVVTVTGRDEGENVNGSPYAYHITFKVAEGLTFYGPDGKPLSDEDAISLAADLTITPRPITITVDDSSKNFGELDPTFTGRITSGELVDGDLVTISYIRTNKSVETPGVYEEVLDATHTANSNYEVTVVRGNFKIIASPIEVRLNAIASKGFTKVYGDADPTLAKVQKDLQDAVDTQLEAQGLNAGDIVVTVDGRTEGEDVGTYAYHIMWENAAGASYQFIPFVEVALSADLTITPKEITIVINDSEKIYGENDPTDKNYGGWELSGDSSWEYTDGLDSLTITIIRSRSNDDENVGTYDEVLIAKDNAWNNPNYTVTFEPGNFEITKRLIEITINDSSKVYGEDDPAPKYSSVELTGGTLASNDKLEDFDIDIYRVGEGDDEDVDTYTRVLRSDYIDDNYDISFVWGNFTITQARVTIIIKDSEKIYGEDDPTDENYGGWKLSDDSTLIEGDTLDVFDIVIYRAGKDDEEDAKEYVGVLRSDSTNANYTIEFEDGTFTIIPRPFEITAKDATKIYDGDELTNDDYDITNDTTLAFEDELVSVDVDGSQTLVGTSENTPSGAVILDAEGNDVTSNYEITYVDGTLTVLPAGGIEVDITAAGAEDDENFTKTYGDTDPTLVEVAQALQDALDALLVEQGLNAGDIVVSVTNREEGEDVADSPYAYTITFDNVADIVFYIYGPDGNPIPDDDAISLAADLTITLRYIEITADSSSKTWDGDALINGDHLITFGSLDGSLLTGNTSSVTVNGSQTVVGSSANVPDETTTVIKDAEGNDVTVNYSIRYANGTLTVLPAGNIEVDLTALGAEDDENFTKIYGDTDPTLVEVAGALQDALDALLVEQGLEAGDILVTVTGREEGETVALSPYAYAITFENVAGIIFYDEDGNIVPDEDAITLAADLTIMLRPVVITADSDTKTWDGEALIKASYLITVGSIDGTLLGGHTLSVTITGSQTVVGSSANIASGAVILDADGVDVTANYDVAYAEGTLVVLPAGNIEVDLTALGAEDDENFVKVYGDADPELSAVADALQNAIDALLVAQGLEAGDIVISVTGRAAGETVLGSPYAYVISFENVAGIIFYDADGNLIADAEAITLAADLTITLRPLTITAGSADKQYDGTVLTNADFSITGGSLAGTQTLGSVIIAGSQTIVGISANVASGAIILDADGVDVTVNYDVAYVDGALEVTVNPTVVNIIAGTASKIYDGLALTTDGFTTTSLPVGITRVEVTISGSQTVVGSSANTIISYQFFNGSQNVTAFFAPANLVAGTLTITPVPAPPVDPEPPAPTTAAYTVIHYNATTGAVLYTQNLTGTIGATVVGVSQTFGGYTYTLTDSRAIVSGTVLANGSLVLRLYYTPVPVEIPDDDVPFVPFTPLGSWALLNLILAALGILLAAAALIVVLLKRREEDEEENVRESYVNEENAAKEKRRRTRILLGSIALAAGVVAIIVFFVTENITLPMAFVDLWTILHGVVMVSQIVLTIFAVKKAAAPKDSTPTPTPLTPGSEAAAA